MTVNSIWRGAAMHDDNPAEVSCDCTHPAANLFSHVLILLASWDPSLTRTRHETNEKTCEVPSSHVLKADMFAV